MNDGTQTQASGGNTQRPLVKALTAVIRGYQRTFSSVLPPTCRYWPSCSEYAIEALQVHGPARGSWLTIKRLCRCHPWGGQGVDPVPPADKTAFFGPKNPTNGQ